MFFVQNEKVVNGNAGVLIFEKLLGNH